ncbi:hypothetical protein ACHAXS_006772 [Conticribra weissflogii]
MMLEQKLSNLNNAMGRTRKLPTAYLAILGLCALTIPFISKTSLYSAPLSPYRRSLAFKDAEYYSTLQAGIDPSVERRAKQSVADSVPGEGSCSEMVAYLPGPFAFHGHGSQINTYIMGIMTTTFMGLPMLLLEPPLDKQPYPGGSQFGCPTDAFRESSSGSGQPNWEVKEGFPMGLSRLIDHPAWLSHGCALPTCPEMNNYVNLTRLLRKYRGGDTLPSVTCQDANGKTVKVILSGSYATRIYFREHEGLFTKQLTVPQAKQWALNLGSSEAEAENFSQLRSGREIWDYAAALMNKSGILRFQPWVARDVEMFVKTYDIPMNEEYDTIHVRRGDKLEEEAREAVINYWKSQGYTDEDNLPTNYIPFSKYLEQYDPNECVAKGVDTIERNVYVATDDPIVVTKEIADASVPEAENIIHSNGCHRLTFYFNPTQDTVFHIDESGDDDSCFARYHRNIVSMADLWILARSHTFIGEYNSNWGRLLRTMRTVMNDDDSEGGSGELTKTIDTRVAWGPDRPRCPGN